MRNSAYAGISPQRENGKAKMTENKIMAILPNTMLVDQVRQVQLRTGFEFPVFHKQVEDALALARESIRKGTKVIISRGLTATFLRNYLEVPVVEIEYDFFQFAYALRNALSLSRNVAIVGFIEAYRLAERAIEFVVESGDHVQVSILPDGSHIERTVRKLGEEGVRVFIGGNTVVTKALELGYRGVFVEPDDKLIEAAIAKAVYELRIYLDREEKFEMIQAIINCASNGIFAVDSQGAISVANPLARKYLQISESDDSGKSIRELIPQSRLLGTITTGETVADDFISIGNVELVMNSAPVIVDGEIRGAVATVQEVGQIQDLDHKIRKKMLHKGHIAQKSFADIIGESAAMKECRKAAQNFAKVDSTILILGKTGTGKEVFAQSIHNASKRASKPFVAVNCAALPSSLLESELFGYTKGAFTGARTEGKAGIFELAHTGTIFLDEISEVPPDVQARLLRVVQEKEITRIGDDKVIPVDVRILAATNRDLMNEVREKRFREDLYYRLSVLELYLPQLSDRREDIPALVRHFVKTICANASMPPVPVDAEALEILMGMPMNGNVRQLCNIVEKVLVISNFDAFDKEGLLKAVRVHEGALDGAKEPLRASPPSRVQPKPQSGGGVTISAMEREMILSAVEECAGNRLSAARRLGISPTTLWRRMKEMGLCP